MTPGQWGLLETICLGWRWRANVWTWADSSVCWLRLYDDNFKRLSNSIWTEQCWLTLNPGLISCNWICASGEVSPSQTCLCVYSHYSPPIQSLPRGGLRSWINILSKKLNAPNGRMCQFNPRFSLFPPLNLLPFHIPLSNSILKIVYPWL